MRDHGIQRVYIHGTVFVPFNTHLHAELRRAVYSMFYFNTPNSLIASLRFRLLFIASTSFGDQISIERLGLTCIPSASVYPGSRDLFESCVVF